MISYEYFCPENGKTISVKHSITTSIKTWGELCKITGQSLDSTPPDVPIERIIFGGTLALKSNDGYKTPSINSDVLSGNDSCIPKHTCCSGGSCKH